MGQVAAQRHAAAGASPYSRGGQLHRDFPARGQQRRADGAGQRARARELQPGARAAPGYCRTILGFRDTPPDQTDRGLERPALDQDVQDVAGDPLAQPRAQGIEGIALLHGVDDVGLGEHGAAGGDGGRGTLVSIRAGGQVAHGEIQALGLLRDERAGSGGAGGVDRVLPVLPLVVEQDEGEALSADGQHVPAARQQAAGSLADRQNRVDDPRAPAQGSGEPDPIVPGELGQLAQALQASLDVSPVLPVVGGRYPCAIQELTAPIERAPMSIPRVFIVSSAVFDRGSSPEGEGRDRGGTGLALSRRLVRQKPFELAEPFGVQRAQHPLGGQGRDQRQVELRPEGLHRGPQGVVGADGVHEGRLPDRLGVEHPQGLGPPSTKFTSSSRGAAYRSGIL